MSRKKERHIGVPWRYTEAEPPLSIMEGLGSGGCHSIRSSLVQQYHLLNVGCSRNLVLTHFSALSRLAH